MDMWPRRPLSGTRRGSETEGEPDTPGGARECQLEERGLTWHEAKDTAQSEMASASRGLMFHQE